MVHEFVRPIRTLCEFTLIFELSEKKNRKYDLIQFINAISNGLYNKVDEVMNLLPVMFTWISCG